ncbi:MAG: hypothetical protein U0S48_19625 [Solirubrobacteraceae bacterium]
MSHVREAGAVPATVPVAPRAHRRIAGSVSAGWRALAARPALICLLIAAIAAISLARQWDGPVLWDPDSLMYQAQTLELRGGDAPAVRHALFFGPLGARARSLDADEPGEPHRVTQPSWVDYSSQFYRRRWLLPALAAGTYSVFGEQSLRTWSLIGYVAIGPLLFLLLRRRFGAGPSLAVTLGCLALGPVRAWSVIPLTDSWGVALMLAGLLAGLAALERGPRWLWAWAAAILALSVTRDTSFVLVAAAIVLLAFTRTRASAGLAATAVAASLPAPLIFSVNARAQLAYVVNDRTIPPDTSWGFIADRYPHLLGDMMTGYARYAADNPLVVAVFVVGLVALYALGQRRDPFFLLLWGIPLGYLALLAIGPTFSAFRYELVLLPCVAAGIALIIELADRKLGWRSFVARATWNQPSSSERSGAAAGSSSSASS